MGIGVYSKHSDDCSDVVLKRADAAMYANKKEMKAGRE
jgi:GGDEF domain-containing protein